MTFEIATYGMTYLGYKIFLDRYALKELDTLFLRSDRLVLVKVNDAGHKELAKVLTTSNADDPVDLVLEDGTEIYDVPLDQIDIPAEYDPKQMFDRVASAVASAEKESIRDEWTVKFVKGDSYIDNFDLPEDFGEGMPKDPPVIERDQVLSGKTYKIRNSFGNCFVTVNFDDNGNPFEVFVNVGKAGSDIQADAEAIGRLISLIFRLSGDVSQSDRLKEVYNQLRGIGTGSSYGFGKDRVCSIPDSIGKALEMFNLEELEGMLEHNEFPGLDKCITTGFQEEKETLGDACPECGNFTFIRMEGCKKCESCGYSVC